MFKKIIVSLQFDFLVSNMENIYIETYGCQMNFADSEVIAAILTKAGYGVCESVEDANKIRKWSTQSREDAAWYQHEEMGYNYRMSNIIAGIIRGQLPYLEEHIAQKKAVYERYREGLADLPVEMNPYDAKEAA